MTLLVFATLQAIRNGLLLQRANRRIDVLDERLKRVDERLSILTRMS